MEGKLSPTLLEIASKIIFNMNRPQEKKEEEKESSEESSEEQVSSEDSSEEETSEPVTPDLTALFSTLLNIYLMNSAQSKKSSVDSEQVITSLMNACDTHTPSSNLYLKAYVFVVSLHSTLKTILADCGQSEERRAAFDKQMNNVLDVLLLSADS